MMEPISVVIVEDDEKLAQALKDVLQMTHEIPVEVTITSDPMDALFYSAKADAVLLDHHLATDGGRDILKRIREQSDVPVIVFTGNDSPEVTLETKALNAELYIKPDARGALEALGKAMLNYARRRFGTQATRVG